MTHSKRAKTRTRKTQKKRQITRKPHSWAVMTKALLHCTATKSCNYPPRRRSLVVSSCSCVRNSCAERRRVNAELLTGPSFSPRQCILYFGSLACCACVLIVQLHLWKGAYVLRLLLFFLLLSFLLSLPFWQCSHCLCKLCNCCFFACCLWQSASGFLCELAYTIACCLRQLAAACCFFSFVFVFEFVTAHLFGAATCPYWHFLSFVKRLFLSLLFLLLTPNPHPQSPLSTPKQQQPHCPRRSTNKMIKCNIFEN